MTHGRGKCQGEVSVALQMPQGSLWMGRAGKAWTEEQTAGFRAGCAYSARGQIHQRSPGGLTSGVGESVGEGSDLGSRDPTGGRLQEEGA